ncbi:Tyrosine-protein kinase [Aphelenchoides fujianensis]|nr:Tyrosine-protein kinase [Aphelenchoides fujianensis]
MGKTGRSTPVEELEFYHGLLPREDIPHLLLRPGDFLLRQSETAAGQARQLIFSVMLADNAIKHVIVQRNGAGQWATDNTRPFFDGVQELVAHYVQSGESMLPHLAGVVLGQPVMRAPWELRHNDVKLGAKLGEGAFGEVKAGTLLLPSKRRVDVAVKLAKTNDAKISDFGMSREGSHYKMPTGRRVPMKWLAPEVITSYLFSPKSDVWAFGVVVWEVYADGTEPFRGVNNAELKNQVSPARSSPSATTVRLQILGGTRLEFPADTPPPVVELVLNDCWAAQAEQRATMAQASPPSFHPSDGLQVARKLEHITGMSPPCLAVDKPPAAPAELQPKRRQSTGSRKPQPSARLKARRSSKNTRTREYTGQD